MKIFRKSFAVILSVAFLSLIFMGSRWNAVVQAAESTGEADDIIILYTNDIHAGINENLGLDTLAAVKKDLMEETPYVTLVDNGDAVQGNYICAASKGVAIIQAMNEAGYDYCILGNHEFDYKIEGLIDMLEEADAKYLNCNITYTGSGEDPFAGMEPYAIENYGGTKVAFVGVDTPAAIFSSTPAYFMEDGEYVIDFSSGEDGKALYAAVQSAVDSARAEGAEYVILMAHLGYIAEVEAYSSPNVISNTTGIDVVLDGHSHSVIEGQFIDNADGEPVLLTSTGEKLANIGKLTISADGTISTELISEYDKKDAEMTAWLENLEDVYEGILGEPLFTLEKTLSLDDENGIRVIRARETGLGNFVADAYRIVMEADIGMCNGGGIRASLEAGDVSQIDLISVNPFGNSLCVIEVSGQELLDAFEYYYRKVIVDFIQEDGTVIDDGSFMSLSGVKVVIDANEESSIVVDENDYLVSVGDTRKVKEAFVLEEGEYVPIDPEAIYTVATSNYIAKNGGSGMGLLFADNNIVIDSAMTDYEALIAYATEYLNGDLSEYFETEGRITVLE